MLASPRSNRHRHRGRRDQSSAERKERPSASVLSLPHWLP
jgi:hypothetical protein